MKKRVLCIGILVLIIVSVYVFGVIKTMSAMPKGELKKYSDSNTEEFISNDGKRYMMAEAVSEEEAREIAELYDITFEGYFNGIGRYSTTKNPDDLFELGNENGYPALELDQKVVKYFKEGE